MFYSPLLRLSSSVIITTLSIVVVLMSLPQTARSIGEKGAQCRKNEDCDQNQFLECVGSSCNCRDGAGLKWVPERNSCMLMEGFPCGDRRQYSNNGYTGRAPCVPNASCSDYNGKCECADDYLGNRSGVCELGYGVKCSSSEGITCATIYLLECSADKNSTCRCQGEGVDFVWDSNRRKCVSKVGGSCDLEGDAGFRKAYQLECVEDSLCVKEGGKGICRCKPNFLQTNRGDCRLQHGERCHRQNCNKDSFLICQDGRCSCEFYGQMKYDEETQQCQLLVGESCIVGTDKDDDISNRNATCVKDAYCEPRYNRSSRGKCKCLPDFEVSKKDYTCTRVRGHRGPCSSSVDCDREQFLECVFDQNQIGHCDCPENHMHYDGQQCRVLPGKSCMDNRICTENAYCEGKWCMCKEGYKVENRECVRFGNQPLQIERSQTCTDFHERTIDWKKCQCHVTPDTHLWVSNETACLALVGTQCLLDSDCIPHAVCDQRERICQCGPSSLTTRKLTCVPVHSPSNKDESQIVSTVSRNLHGEPEQQFQDNLNDDMDMDMEMRTLKSVKVNPYANSVGSRIYYTDVFIMNFIGATLTAVTAILS